MADVVTVPAQSTLVDQGHDQQMIDKANGVTPPETLLAGKYKSEDELKKGIEELLKKKGSSYEVLYKDLEREVLGQKPPQQQQAPPQQTQQQQTPPPQQTKPNAPPADNTKTGVDAIDFPALSQEYAQKGQLSEESYVALEQKGFSREYVDAYIDGQKAIADRNKQEVFNLVGGEQNFESLKTWAAQSLSDEEKEAYNQAVNGTVAQAKLAVEALYARYVNANGNPPRLVQPRETAGFAGTDVYHSRAEMIRDMSDDRYKNDPHFQKMVKEKLGRSNIF